jgi:hypothetical protein
MASALLRGGRSLRELAMQLAHTRRLGHPDEARGEQRMGERHVAVAEDHHAGLHSGVECVADGGVEAVGHRLSQQGGTQECLESRL